MTEQQIQKKILDYLKTLEDTWAVKTIESNKKGTPDILACHQGWFLAIEVKRPGNKASPIQDYQLDQIQKAGGLAIVAYSVDDVRNYILEL